MIYQSTTRLASENVWPHHDGQSQEQLARSSFDGPSGIPLIAQLFPFSDWQILAELTDLKWWGGKFWSFATGHEMIGHFPFAMTRGGKANEIHLRLLTWGQNWPFRCQSCNNYNQTTEICLYLKHHSIKIAFLVGARYRNALLHWPETPASFPRLL